MSKIKGKIYLLFAFSLAGTSVITGYILSETMGSFTVTFVSLGIMLLCLAPFYGGEAAKTIRQLKSSDWKMLILQAIFGIFLFRIFLLSGVSLTSTVEAGILTGTAPAITAVLAYLVLKEIPSGWTAAGIACTVMGIVLLAGVNIYSATFSAEHIGGNVLILCAMVSESTFNIISRRHRAKQLDKTDIPIHPLVQTLIVSAVAFVLSIIPALMEQPFIALQMIGLNEWLALIWYGLIVTALAFVFFYAGVKHCDAYTTAAFSGMIPLTSMLLSLLLLRETISFVQWGGGFLIISSMLMIGNRHRQPHRQASGQ